jgi:hypothetical protein
MMVASATLSPILGMINSNCAMNQEMKAQRKGKKWGLFVENRKVISFLPEQVQPTIETSLGHLIFC